MSYSLQNCQRRTSKPNTARRPRTTSTCGKLRNSPGRTRHSREVRPTQGRPTAEARRSPPPPPPREPPPARPRPPANRGRSHARRGREEESNRRKRPKREEVPREEPKGRGRDDTEGKRKGKKGKGKKGKSKGKSKEKKGYWAYDDEWGWVKYSFNTKSEKGDRARECERKGKAPRSPTVLNAFNKLLLKGKGSRRPDKPPSDDDMEPDRSWIVEIDVIVGMTKMTKTKMTMTSHRMGPTTKEEKKRR